MAGLGNKIKLTVLKGMEAVGQSASSLASNAQQKLQELNLETQRRDILSDFPLRAYDLWQKGETLPQPLEKMLKDLSDVDERLGVLRAQRYAKVEHSADANAEPEEACEGCTGEAETAVAPSEPSEDSAPQEQAAAEDQPEPDENASMDEGEGDNA